MELANILTGIFFYLTGVATGVLLSSYYYEQISIAVAKYGGIAVILLCCLGFVAGFLVERARKPKFSPLTVGRVEQVGMDVVRAISTSVRRAGIKKVVER